MGIPPPDDTMARPVAHRGPPPPSEAIWFRQDALIAEFEKVRDLALIASGAIGLDDALGRRLFDTVQEFEKLIGRPQFMGLEK